MNRIAVATVFIAACASGAPAVAQNGKTIYRCGDSYSQTPCAGGREVKTDDARSAGQKSQTDSAVRRDAQSAATLEKDRLGKEAQARPFTPAVAEPAAEAPSVAKKLAKPEQFTARVPGKPGDKPKKKKKKKKKAQP